MNLDEQEEDEAEIHKDFDTLATISGEPLQKLMPINEE